MVVPTSIVPHQTQCLAEFYSYFGQSITQSNFLAADRREDWESLRKQNRSHHCGHAAVTGHREARTRWTNMKHSDSTLKYQPKANAKKQRVEKIEIGAI